jgi:glycosyltransferase involved in cell wall biosynthesis
VGRVSREKGLDDFCKLDYPNATKIIVGDGPYRAELERKYPEVEFTGVKTGRELVEYYANADVFVFTSRVDTFGMVIIEAMSVGTPVAAYPVAGPLDIIFPGVTGHMSEDLNHSIDVCMQLKRDRVERASLKWSWEECWKIFRNNLIELR